MKHGYNCVGGKTYGTDRKSSERSRWTAGIKVTAQIAVGPILSALLNVMSNLLEEISVLKAKVRASFPKSGPLPGESLVHRSHEPDFEADSIQRAFEGRSWTVFGESELTANEGCIWFFTPEAFRFYLPAYLWVALDEVGVSYAGPILMLALSPPPDGLFQKTQFDSRVEGFCADQAQVIDEVLKFIFDRFPVHFDEPDVVLRTIRFWRGIHGMLSDNREI